MDSFSRLLAQRGQGSAWRRRKRFDWGWAQILVGLPLSLMMLAMVVVLAVPDLCRRRANAWEEFGDH